jgi:transposase InsO family protein
MIGSLARARVVIGDWKQDYNHRRRHSSLGYGARSLRCCVHPPMIDSHGQWISSRIRSSGVRLAARHIVLDHLSNSTGEMLVG